MSALPHIPWTKDPLNKLKIPLSSGVWALENPPAFDFILEPRSTLHSRQMEYGGTFLSLALKFHLVDYVVSRVATGCLVQRFWLHTSLSNESSDTKTSPWRIWPLLLDAINSGPASWHPGVMEKLLCHGANPNFVIPDQPNSIPWVNAMKFLIKSTRRTRTTPDGWRWNYRQQDLPIQHVWLPLVEHGGCRLDDGKLDDELDKFLLVAGGIKLAGKLPMLKRHLGRPVPETLVKEDFKTLIDASEMTLNAIKYFAMVTEDWIKIAESWKG